jgi:hypothetical protein
MKFNTKRDKFFIYLWVYMLVIINAVLIVPTFFETDLRMYDYFGIFSIDVLVSGMIIWIALDISYTIRPEYLLVKAGIFRSRILYKDITKITFQPNIWVGYKLLFSRDAIEIHYKTGFIGSVIISPENQEIFIEELKTRNLLINIEKI